MFAGFVLAVPSSAVAGSAADPTRQIETWDHLEPGRPFSDGTRGAYEEIVTTFLREAYGEDVLLRVVAHPPFTPEYAVGIRQGAAETTVFRMGPERPLAAYRDTPEEIAMVRCERPIDAGLAARIGGVWKAMLLDARHPPKHRIVYDGVTYHFSMPLAGRGPAEAHIMTPAGGRTGQLVGIAGRMARYCNARDTEAERERLEAAVATLAAGLEAAGAATAGSGPR